LKLEVFSIMHNRWHDTSTFCISTDTNNTLLLPKSDIHKCSQHSHTFYALNINFGKHLKLKVFSIMHEDGTTSVCSVSVQILINNILLVPKSDVHECSQHKAMNHIVDIWPIKKSECGLRSLH